MLGNREKRGGFRDFTARFSRVVGYGGPESHLLDQTRLPCADHGALAASEKQAARAARGNSWDDTDIASYRYAEVRDRRDPLCDL